MPYHSFVCCWFSEKKKIPPIPVTLGVVSLSDASETVECSFSRPVSLIVVLLQLATNSNKTVNTLFMSSSSVAPLSAKFYQHYVEERAANSFQAEFGILGEDSFRWRGLHAVRVIRDQTTYTGEQKSMSASRIDSAMT